MTQVVTPPAAQLKVLIIDDDPAALRSIAGTLRINDFQTIETDCGEAGVDSARTKNPDLIVCDVSMPGVSGYEVLSELRKDPRTAIIPFIFISGKRDEELVRQGMGLGADDYLLKPFTPDQLVGSIEARIARQRALTQKMERLRLNLAQSVPAEFFNPLNAILGFSTLLMDTIQGDGEIARDELEDSVGHIRSAGEELLRIASNYVLYSDLLINPGYPTEVPILPDNWDAIMSREVRMQVIEDGRMKDLHYSFEPANVAISMDHLRTLVHELLRNALKFSSPGDRVNVTGCRAGDHYMFCVRDQGTGMTHEQIESFSPNLASQPDIVTGLGLSICQLIVSRYRGTINISTNPDVGISVEVNLPLG